MADELYLPIRMEVERVRAESDDRMLRTLDLSFQDAGKEFEYLPGQFCQLSVLGKGEAPFGIASAPSEPGFLRFTVNRVGVVTTAIHYLRPGDAVGLRGPLGNHYPVEKLKGENVVVIGGGFAFTTLRSLVVYFLAHRGDYGQVTVIYGARRPGLLLYRDELAEWKKRDDLELHLTIDKEAPGWEGRVGFVPTVTKEVGPKPEKSWAVVCGPPVMIKYTLPVLGELGFPPERVYTSLERKMKCGVGKCGRCNIGPKYVCVDGPVFSYAELGELPESF
jgi:NAD(P)H-flavin reductase